MEPFGIIAGDQQFCCGVRTDTEQGEQVRCSGCDEGLDLLVQRGDLDIQGLDAMSQGGA